MNQYKISNLSYCYYMYTDFSVTDYALVFIAKSPNTGYIVL